MKFTPIREQQNSFEPYFWNMKAEFSSTVKHHVYLLMACTMGVTQLSEAQVPCDMLGMIMNVGSQETAINIYHSGQYMTHPQEHNVFVWEFSDQQGNLLHQDTIVNDAFCSFGHSWSLTDTVNVTVTLVNDEAVLADSGNSINCLFEDQIYWETGEPTPWGSWTFIHNNPGTDLNTSTGIGHVALDEKKLIKILDALGREVERATNQILFYIYDDGSVQKRFVVE